MPVNVIVIVIVHVRVNVRVIVMSRVLDQLVIVMEIQRVNVLQKDEVTVLLLV